jgi:hypothetical protein
MSAWVTKPQPVPGRSARRAAEVLLTLGAAGEIGVGLLVAALPALVMGLLLGAPLDRTGELAARIMGIAAAALGLSWWPDRNRLDPRRLRQIAPSFVGYNLGVGLLFLARSVAIGRALSVSSLVAAVHLLVAVAFAAIGWRTEDRASTASAVDSADQEH